MIVSLLRDRITLAWLVLVAATIVSWQLGLDHGIGSHVGASAVILVVSFVKVRIVGLYFMEIRNAPSALRAPFETYCLGMCLVLVLLLLLHG